MLINVFIIETGGVADATRQNYKLSVCRSTPEAIACLGF